ncbi:Uncharacterised protein [Mycobacterium tuberculosis]|uniref:Uncharacterized protein n=1 Tax=Mycobacterium tuberculosis TaxID=1773 RepID=A0A916LHI2_MYCTX|nr:Uncharacterised protein [Mycobacterium tuberculosis]
MQAGQGGFDDGEDLLEVGVIAIVGILDIERMGSRAWVE